MSEFGKRNQCIVARGAARIKLAAGGPLTRRRLRMLENRKAMLSARPTGKSLSVSK